MSAVPPRKFTLLDAMMLVAATAIAIPWSCGMLSGVVKFRPIHRSAMIFREPGIWEQIVGEKGAIHSCLLRPERWPRDA